MPKKRVSLRANVLMSEAIPSLFIAVMINGIASVASTLPRNDTKRVSPNINDFVYNRVYVKIAL